MSREEPLAPGGRALRLVLWALALAGLAWRVTCAPTTPATFDEVSFLTALSHYDLLAFEPHFPGYPLAVGAGRLAAGAGSDAPYALAGALLTGLAFVALNRAIGARSLAGAWAIAIWAWLPLAASEGLRPLADTLGTALVALGAALLIPHARPTLLRLAGGVALLAAAAAAKPDYALFLALAIWPALRLGARGLATAFVCVLPWALLTLLAGIEGAGGWDPFWVEAARFLDGHLTDWGGLDAPTRPRIVWALAPLGHCVGPPLLGLLGTALLAALALRAPRAWRHLALGVAPYGAWLVFGQNLAHPRHALPLLPILLLLAGRGLRRTSPRIQRGALGLVALAAVGTLLASPAWLEGGRPLDALVVWGRAHPGARIYAGASERPLRWHLPQADVRRARDLAGVRADLLADPTPPPAVWILATEVRGALELPQASGELRVLILQRE